MNWKWVLLLFLSRKKFVFWFSIVILYITFSQIFGDVINNYVIFVSEILCGKDCIKLKLEDWTYMNNYLKFLSNFMEKGVSLYIVIYHHFVSSRFPIFAGLKSSGLGSTYKLCSFFLFFRILLPSNVDLFSAHYDLQWTFIELGPSLVGGCLSPWAGTNKLNGGPDIFRVSYRLYLMWVTPYP